MIEVEWESPMARALIHDWFDGQSAKEGHGSLALLRSSSQLYQEVSSQLYSRDLHFRFNVTWDGTGSITWTSKTLTVKHLHGIFLRDFLFTNFARFRKIIFEVEPLPEELPHSHIIGHFMCIKAVVEIVSDIQQCFINAQDSNKNVWFHRSAHLPHVTIAFIEPNLLKWTVDGLTRKSSDRLASDIELCLNCFKNLRRSREVLLELPKDTQLDERLSSVMNDIKRQISSNDLVPLTENDPFHQLNMLHWPFIRLTPYKWTSVPLCHDFRLWYLTQMRVKLGLELPSTWPGHPSSYLIKGYYKAWSGKKDSRTHIYGDNQSWSIIHSLAVYSLEGYRPH